MISSTSFPFATPAPGLRIRPGSPPLRRPVREEIESFPARAGELLEETWKVQKPLVESGVYDLQWM